MTVELSESMQTTLQKVKAGEANPPDPEDRGQLGALKRYGLVTKTRNAEGEAWALTDAGKKLTARKKKAKA